MLCNKNIGNGRAPVKSNAQRQREYRNRKKIEKQQQSAQKKPKTNAQRQQEFRKNQKTSQCETFIMARRKKNAERAKRYRDNLKLKKQCAELSLLSSKEDSLLDLLIENNKETLNYPNNNSKESIFTEFQVQTIVSSMSDEAQQGIHSGSQSFKGPNQKYGECSINASMLHETNIAGNDIPNNTALDHPKHQNNHLLVLENQLIEEMISNKELWKNMMMYFETSTSSWHHMKSLVLYKLKTLYAADDETKNILANDQMSQMDWTLFDFVLVHEEIDLIQKDGMRFRTQDRQPLIDLFELVTKFDIEDNSGDSLAGAWTAVTTLYNSRGRQCSPMLLQKRWYQLKEVTRETLYEYWNVHRENSSSLTESIQKPTKLQRAVVQKYPSIVTSAFPEWRELIKNRLVILSEDFEQRNSIINAKACTHKESKFDLEGIDSFIERMGVECVEKPRLIIVSRSRRAPKASSEAGQARSAGSTRRRREKQKHPSESSKKQPKTGAQRTREYLERKKFSNALGSIAEQSELRDLTSPLKCNDMTEHKKADENVDGTFRKNPFGYSCSDLTKAPDDCEEQLEKKTVAMPKSSTSRSDVDRLRKAAEKRAERNRRYRARQRALRDAAAQQLAPESRDPVCEQITMDHEVDKREQNKKLLGKKPALTGAERARRFRASQRARKKESELADNRQQTFVNEENKKWMYNAEASIDTDSKQDLEVIEPFIETIDVDQDLDSETRKHKTRRGENYETNGMIIEIKSEAGDFEDPGHPFIENETCDNASAEDVLKIEKSRSISPTLDYFCERTENSNETKAKLNEKIVPEIVGIYGNEQESEDSTITKVYEEESMILGETKCHRDATNNVFNAVDTQECILQDTKVILKSEMEEQLHLNIFDNVMEFADNQIQPVENDHVNTAYVVQTKNYYASQKQFTYENGNSTPTSESKYHKVLFDLKDDEMKITTNKPHSCNESCTSEHQLNVSEIQTDVNKIPDISNAMHPALFLESKTGAQNENRTDDSTKVKMSSYLLHKPRNRLYNNTQICKNPDFNKKLKGLTDAFLSSPRNRVLLNACRPITVDVMKAFESKLFNGTVYLKDCGQPTPNVPGIASRSSTNIRVVDTDHLMSQLNCNTPNLTQENCDNGMEINKKINQPDTTKVPCSNQCSLTIEVPSLTVRTNHEGIAATPELKSNLLFTEKETAISSKKKPRKEFSVENNCVLTLDVLNQMLVKIDEDEHNSSRVTLGTSSHIFNSNTQKSCKSPTQNTTEMGSAVGLFSERNDSTASDNPIVTDNIVVDGENVIIEPVFTQKQYQTDKHDVTTSNAKTLVIEPLFNNVTKQSKKLMFLASLASQQTLDKRKEIDKSQYFIIENDSHERIVKDDGNFYTT